MSRWILLRLKSPSHFKIILKDLPPLPFPKCDGDPSGASRKAPVSPDEQ